MESFITKSILQTLLSNGLCQLYAVNSQSEDVRIEVDGTLNPVSTVFEVLDKCAVSLSSNKDDIANRLEPELKQKLEEWTDQPEEKHEKATESESDDTQKSTESSGESHRKETSESIHTEHPKTKIAVSEFNEPHIIPEDNQERSSDRSRFRTLVSSRGQWVSGVYDGRNFGLQPVPIRPTQVLRGGAPISCAGANCYAPAVVVSPQLVYSPCPALAGDPCAPHPPPPCQTVSQQAPCAPPITSFPQTAAQPRAVEAFWSEWSPLTPCSVTCGSGIAQRRRFCSKEGQCSGTSVREEPCEREPCDQWSPWSDWSSCTRSCGGGEQERRRFCVSGRNCEGPSQDARRCNEEPCAAEWTPWSRWEPCSVTCGLGKQQRFRQCVEGLTCLGRPSEERPCEAGQCPSWSPWQPWSECSKSCDTGQKFRSRFCEGGRTCDGNAEENVLCNQQACPEWIEWTQWSTCSETCGAATKLRTRECMYKNVRSSLCEGAAQDQAPCRVPPCPEWSDWNDWSPCSVTCGHGQQLRFVSLRLPSPKNRECLLTVD
ncbi:Hemicentin-1 [Toxocara canis]|uniref:Hemicentin-1 n=1 Tax=Toxocara canis TaxID=6265 RepID=A0A0B2V152_TOXCA|nr:Hemicentin-1 [Toxocara canis]